MDKTELGCLRAIVLFNPGADAMLKSELRLTRFLNIYKNPFDPNMFWNFSADAKGLSNSSEVELLREKVYASLEAYCKQRYPEQQGR